MALTKTYLEFIDSCIKKSLGGFEGKRMLELGNQRILDASDLLTTGKRYYTRKGMEHISIDLNGEDGALSLDLSLPIEKKEWLGYFDVITNSGTSEHVEPFEGQYYCFKNIHDFLKVGGISIHLIPDAEELKRKGAWKYHCNNYYSKKFMDMLANENEYRLVSLAGIDNLVCACLEKIREKPFMNNKKFFLKNIKREHFGTVYPGINDQGTSFFTIFFRRIFLFLDKSKGFCVRGFKKTMRFLNGK